MPAGRRRGQEIGEVLVQAAAHSGQPGRARPQRRLEPVHGHGDQFVPLTQAGGRLAPEDASRRWAWPNATTYSRESPWNRSSWCIRP